MLRATLPGAALAVFSICLSSFAVALVLGGGPRASTVELSIYQALRCGIALAELVGEPQPEWELAVGLLEHAIMSHREMFLDKGRYSMDWYYPVLGGAIRGPAAAELLAERWDEFVIAGYGARCVSDRPWVTGAETAELAIALITIGDFERARSLLADIQCLRESDDSYWTGLVVDDGLFWPVEASSWTSAAIVLSRPNQAGRLPVRSRGRPCRSASCRADTRSPPR